MELKDYQEKAMTTCMESSRNYSYMAGNLSAEVGEPNQRKIRLK